ncbi:hypothetical protein SAMN05421788_10386 [Filimonas lacunae]|uniref:Dolichyl-phosphate-mannose-protein mannosyltransferase n=1 Tax=Filimonas lacunae TaxID=477680 RepID=A0A173MJE6_9BACT|nr:hypothetical protein [Filimonas lacunae]BAV07734.1 hypothetical protein FLA_3765 [Filimonas lacunae]SIT04217.1 hypothetical protein SAMN05421788_10386 [Filimonas lacunae]
MQILNSPAPSSDAGKTETKDLFTVAILAMVVVFVVYKIIYPFPDFMPDSYFYMGMAKDKYQLVPHIWPVGYAWFLRTLHFFSSGHYVYVVVQYLFLQLFSLHFLATLFKVFNPPRRIKITMLAFLVFNPMYLYLANLIASDAVFIALTVAWLHILVLMVTKPQWWHFLAQVLLLTYLMILRLQALYYPVLLLIALFFTRYTFIAKAATVVGVAFLMGWFVTATKQANEKALGIRIFNGFSGYQLANNAMYMYPYIQHDTNVFAHTPQAEIDRHVREYNDTAYRNRAYITPFDGPGLILTFDGPLKYHEKVTLHLRNPDKSGLWCYHKAGEDMALYGRKLIVEHPIAYARYYLLPNVINYLLPMEEQFWKYNEGHDYVWLVAQQWFGLQNGVYCYWLFGSHYVAQVFKCFFLWLNGMLLGLGIVVLSSRAYKRLQVCQGKVLLVLSVAFVLNALFSILASPVMFRYQVYAMFMGWIILWLFLPLTGLVASGQMFRAKNSVVPDKGL